MTKYKHVRVDFDKSILSGLDLSKTAFRLTFRERFQAGNLIWNRRISSTKVTQEGFISSRELPSLEGAQLDNTEVDTESLIVSSLTIDPAIQIDSVQEAVDTAQNYTGNWYVFSFTPSVSIPIEIAGGRGADGTGAAVQSDAIGGKGALVQGTLRIPEELKNEKLLCVPGRGGVTTSSSSSTSGGCTGAGGGGSYLVLTRSDLTVSDLDLSKGIVDLKTDTTISDGTTLTTGSMIQLLACAAGGSGGDDGAYKGQPALAGSGEFQSISSTSVSSNYDGAGFYQSSAPSSSYPKALNYGGGGSTYNYTRNGTSYAGFGGGGANQDDAYGGRGGGVNRTAASATGQAYSWVNPDYVTNAVGTTGGNTESNGYIRLTKVGEYTTSGTATLTALPAGEALIKVETSLPDDSASVTFITNKGEIDISSSHDWSSVEYLTVRLDNPLGELPVKVKFVEVVNYDTSGLTQSVTVEFEEYFNNALESPTIIYESSGVLTGPGSKPLAPFTMELEELPMEEFPRATLGELFTFNRTGKITVVTPLSKKYESHKDTDIYTLKQLQRISGETTLTLLSPVKP